MERFRVEGGHRLSGAVRVHCAKNAVLPILAGAILADDPTTVLDCPDIADVSNMVRILQTLGCEVSAQGAALRVAPSSIHSDTMPEDLSKRLRSSVFMMGALLGRLRRAVVPYPGGCEIGQRPIDLHLSGLTALGVDIREEGGLVVCDGGRMRGGEVHLDYPSVGATENVMMAAARIPGRTVIHNAAREPEIADLQRFLNACGARIAGAGSATIEIEGVRRMRGATYRPMPDRIEAGTLLAAAAVTGGEVELTDAPMEELGAVMAKLREMGCRVEAGAGRVALAAPPRLDSPGQLITLPYPGFPTDMQAQMLALTCCARGTSIITETVFENRFTHVGDLRRMGANIVVKDRTAIVRGVRSLHGARVCARDLRGGAALLIAGLAAHGETVVEGAEIIDRGYERLEWMLGGLGARIRRERQTDE